MKRMFVKLIGGERRQAYTVPLTAILLSLIASALLLLAVGKNPLTAFRAILSGAGLLHKANYPAGKGMLTDVMSTLSALTPMIFAALGVTAAFKTGLFNIGISGQMLFSGFTATILVGYSGLPAVVAKPLVLVIGILCGGMVGALIGWLKDRFNINEVVSSIMLNYILQYVIGFFILTRYIDTITRHSRAISAAARLVLADVTLGRYKTELPVCVFLAVAAAVLLRFYFDRTRGGFELRAVGSNLRAARYIGIRPGGKLVWAMTLSGALAGLAGVTYYLGYYDSITPKALSSVGFDAIAVSLLGNANPIGALGASVLVTVVDKGSTYMSSVINVQREIAAVITGLILLFSACGAFIRRLVNRARAEAGKGELS